MEKASSGTGESLVHLQPWERWASSSVSRLFRSDRVGIQRRLGRSKRRRGVGSLLIFRQIGDTAKADQMIVTVLGSSFAAGPGIEPIVDSAAKRSGRNYASIVAEALKAELVDLSVSGATTDTILYTAQRPSWFGPSIPPQIQGCPTKSDIVLITAGGNNLSYSASTIKSAVRNHLWRTWYTAPLSLLFGNQKLEVGQDELDGAIKGLVGVVTAVRERAPQAKISLVDYLTVFSAASIPSDEVPLEADEIEKLRKLGLQLDGVFERAAETSGAALVKCSTLSADHGVGTAEPWVTAFAMRNGAAPFHPNAKGMQKAAEEVLRVLKEQGIHDST